MKETMKAISKMFLSCLRFKRKKRPSQCRARWPSLSATWLAWNYRRRRSRLLFGDFFREEISMHAMQKFLIKRSSSKSAIHASLVSIMSDFCLDVTLFISFSSPRLLICALKPFQTYWVNWA